MLELISCEHEEVCSRLKTREEVNTERMAAVPIILYPHIAIVAILELLVASPIKTSEQLLNNFQCNLLNTGAHPPVARPTATRVHHGPRSHDVT